MRTYSVAVLPSAEGRSCVGIRIAQNGDVLLVPAPPTDYWQAFIYDGREVKTVATPAATQFGGQSINSSGQVAGNLFAMAGLDPVAGYQGAAVWADGVLTVLPHPGRLPAWVTTAVGINGSGDVAGMWQGVEEETYRAVLWKNGEPVLIDGDRERSTITYGINDNGTVVGGAWSDVDLAWHPVLWDDGVVTDIAGIPGIPGNAFINNAEQLLIPAHERDSSGVWLIHWYLWESGHATEIPGLVGPVFSLDVMGFNAHGTIIGNVDGHAVVYQDGTLHDLNAMVPAGSGWDLTAAYGINDAGQIVGKGLYNGEPAAFLLTPVPEPVACVLSGLAAGLLLHRRRDRGRVRRA